MSAPPLPSTLSLYRLAKQRADTLAPRVLTFGWGEVDDQSRGVPYLIIDPDPGFDEVARGDGRTSSRRGRFRVLCGGSTVEQAALAESAARDLFTDWRPYESLRFGAARLTDTDPLYIDRSAVTDLRFYFGLTFEVDD